MTRCNHCSFGLGSEWCRKYHALQDAENERRYHHAFDVDGVIAYVQSSRPIIEDESKRAIAEMLRTAQKRFFAPADEESER